MAKKRGGSPSKVMHQVQRKHNNQQLKKQI